MFSKKSNLRIKFGEKIASSDILDGYFIEYFSVDKIFPENTTHSSS